MPHSLFDDFKEGGYHSSILSTFGVDPAFYDSSLQLRLRGFGCLNNLLVADAAMLNQALESVPEAFTHAGRKYLIQPVATQGCFHAKLALRYGKAKARLIIGSANVTTAGWAGNLELVSALYWNARDENPDSEVHQGLIVRAHHWLSSLLGDDNKMAYKLELLHSQSPWIGDEPDIAAGPFVLSDGSEIDLLLSKPSDTRGLGDRMLSLIDEPIERFTVISPYWDDRLTALRRLHGAVSSPDLRIFMSLTKANPSRSSTFPIDALEDLNATFYPISDADSADNRFLHAKLFLFQGAEHDFLFLGSANCTVAALGLTGKAGANYECLLFRKLERETAERLLGLNYGTKLALSDISSPPAKVEPSIDPMLFSAGSIERNGNMLFWTPDVAISAEGAKVEVADLSLPLTAQNHGIWLAPIGDNELTATVARIRLPDGRLSRPVVITNSEELVKFAPFPLAGSLRLKLDAVLNGEADLISLARDIHLLLEDDAKIAPTLERIRASSATKVGKTVAGRDFGSAEEFRNSLNLRASMKSVGMVHADSPALQALLQIVLRGMISIESVGELDARAADEAKNLDLGEDQDEEGWSDSGELPASARQTPNHAELITLDDFHRNQAALWRGIGKFQDFLDQLKGSQSELDLNFVTRVLFMLYLMLHGCTKQYRIEGGATDVLIQFGSNRGEEFRDSFLHIAAQAILALWGPNFARSLICRLRFSAEDNALPLQIVTLVVVSQWVLAAILAEVRANPAHKSLRAVLERQVPGLFAATLVFPEIDIDEQVAVIEQMERNIGMDPNHAKLIRSTLNELMGLRRVAA